MKKYAKKNPENKGERNYAPKKNTQKDFKKARRNIISEAAEIYGVSASCLRYWEKEGLIDFERDDENNYRRISYSIAERIGNIVMFRKLAIPISELKNLQNIGMEEFDSLLTKSEKELIEKFFDILDSIEQIHAKRELLDKIRKLQETPFCVVKHALEAIEPYYYYKQESVIPFLTEPNRFAVMIKADNPTYVLYGFFKKSWSKAADALLREADKKEKLYLRGLLKIASDNMLQHNSLAFVEKAKELGYTPGEIVGRYLITLNDGKPFDFYEAWISLEP